VPRAFGIQSFDNRLKIGSSVAYTVSDAVRFRTPPSHKRRDL